MKNQESIITSGGLHYDDGDHGSASDPHKRGHGLQAILLVVVVVYLQCELFRSFIEPTMNSSVAADPGSQ